MGFSSRRITLMIHFLFSLVGESTLVPMESRNSVHRIEKVSSFGFDISAGAGGAYVTYSVNQAGRRVASI